MSVSDSDSEPLESAAVEVWLLKRVNKRDVTVLARGHVGGDAAGHFIRSLITDTATQAECIDGWEQWRWYLRHRNGKWTVDKVRIDRRDDGPERSRW